MGQKLWHAVLNAPKGLLQVCESRSCGAEGAIVPATRISALVTPDRALW